ncbi:hypothetical protein ACFSJW_23115 [Flavobacterium artemisiae]|uniref:Uncharacterized protein n=1 Tax=Flavobacterium artemisiae TaxID=2126556 RepID=A0ABW4H7Q8_9FLAO
MGIVKQAKNITIQVARESTIIVKENMDKTASKVVLRTSEGDITMIAAKHLKAKSNGD